MWQVFICGNELFSYASPSVELRLIGTLGNYNSEYSIEMLFKALLFITTDHKEVYYIGTAEFLWYNIPLL